MPRLRQAGAGADNRARAVLGSVTTSFSHPVRSAAPEPCPAPTLCACSRNRAHNVGLNAPLLSVRTTVRHGVCVLHRAFHGGSSTQSPAGPASWQVEGDSGGDVDSTRAPLRRDVREPQGRRDAVRGDHARCGGDSLGLLSRQLLAQLLATDRGPGLIAELHHAELAAAVGEHPCPQRCRQGRHCGRGIRATPQLRLPDAGR